MSGAGIRRLRAIPQTRRLQADRRLPRRQTHARRDHQDHGGLRSARPGRGRLAGGAQMAHRRRGARAASHGAEHRRGRAGNLQGPLVPRARSASLSRVHAGRRLVRGRGRDLHLPQGRIRRLPRRFGERTAQVEKGSALRAAADPRAPRRRGVHLRRRVGDDRVDRGQARHAAPAPAVRRAGRPLQPSDARAQPGDGVLGAPDRRAGRGLVRRPWPQRQEGAALVLGVGPGEAARRAPRSGRHHRARADRRVLRRHARRPPVLCLPAGRRLGRHPARREGRRPPRLRHAAALRQLHRLGGGRDPVAARLGGCRGRQSDEVLPRGIVRQVHAVPRWHGQGAGADGREQMEPAVAWRALTGHDGRLDLRPGPGGAQSRADRHEILPARGAVMERVTQQQVAMMPIEFKLNGQTVVGRPDELIIETARRHGISIPHLCYTRTLRPDGNCRACVVEVKGERALAPSCCRFPTQGMEVTTDSARALASQKMVLELLLADMPEHEYTLNNKVDVWARNLKVGKPRFKSRVQPKADLSHPAIAVNLDACIQCTRCVRACREEQVNDVIGYAGRGDHSKIVFDFDDPMGESTCVACGECVQACPTGALMPARDAGLQAIDKKVDSVCPFCGVGCLLTYHVKENKIQFVTGKDGPSNHGRLCVKGRYGFDYAHHPHRLTKPLIRKPGVGKSADFVVDPGNWSEVFREASWEEALELAAKGLARIRDEDRYALAGFGSAKGSNEEAFLFQKLVRTGFGTNNVDHCTRLCHASSVAALMEGINSGAVSNQVNDVQNAEVIFLIGANPASNHPVAATWMKNAAKNGVKLIVADPRRNELARHATQFLQFKPDTDVALLNAMIHSIIAEDLVDKKFIAERTSGFEALKENAKSFSPEKMAPVCGVPAQTIREVARLYATSKGSMILWGMGISQHVHGTDNARCLIALTLMTGQIGRPGTGLHPLRGQNNVQGASDSGLIPMVFPDYQRVDHPDANQRFEKLWGMALDKKPGLTVVEIMNAAYDGSIPGMYIMGENPAMSDPDLEHARTAMARLEHLVVQDIFLTEPAYLADVVLPATAWPEKEGSVTNTDRMVQLGRRALEAPGEAREDLWIIVELAKRLGLSWNYSHPREVFNEMRSCMDSIKGITWERLERDSSVTYPCENEGDPAQPVVFQTHFPTATGRAKFVPADLIGAAERPDRDYPMVLITGRQLEHWHTGAITRRSGVLDAIEPEPVASLHPLDLAALGAKPGELVTVESRRGKIALYARADAGTPRGAVFIPFCYYEAAANELTNPALDPFGKIPEFKYCAVRVTRGGQRPGDPGYGKGRTLGELYG